MVGFVVQTAQRGDVAVDVEGVGRTLAVAASEPVELDVREVEPVHGQVADRLRDPPQRVGATSGLGERRLAGTGCAGDAEEDATRPVEERRRTVDQGGHGRGHSTRAPAVGASRSRMRRG